MCDLNKASFPTFEFDIVKWLDMNLYVDSLLSHLGDAYKYLKEEVLNKLKVKSI